MNINLSASILIENKNNVWIEDKMVKKCFNCKTSFGYLNRKHHCRNCGNIFCSYCADNFIVIPSFIHDKPEAADYWNISYYIKSLRNNKERVCKKCFNDINEKNKIYEKIVSIFNSPITIDQIKELSDSNIYVKNYYFDHLRNIQYYLPNHVYSKIDKNLLKINAPFFSGHSKYLIHLIKSIEWDNPIIRKNTNSNDDQLLFISSIINSNKNKNCDELYCTRTCQECLSCDDCINILYLYIINNKKEILFNSKIYPEELLDFLFKIIQKTPDQVILCHLTFFINLIKINNKDHFLNLCIFNLLSRNIKLLYHTFWFLSNIKEISNLQEIINIDNFIHLFDYDLLNKMSREYKFFSGLIANLNNLNSYLNNFDHIKPICLPYDPDVQILDIAFNEIKFKSSYTKPVIIPFLTSKGKINILFKKESIMNDVIVLNLMTLSDIILNETLELPFNSIVYPIIPLTNDSGMIEIIDKATTLYDITINKKTILEHIIERNEDKVISDILDKYMYSLVSYTLHSYFLGLGDRHLQNIMITDDGAIFHIDFGFILGNDASPITSSDIKLNSGMIDVIGGFEGIRYKKYLELCSIGVILLRKFFNMFFILLSLNNNFEEKHIEKFILSKFQPRQIDNTVITELITIIKQSNNNYSDYIRDFLHYHTQEKTIQTSLGNIFGYVFKKFN